MDKKLEKKIKDWSPEAQRMIREVWECNDLDDLRRLVFKWDKEGIFKRADAHKSKTLK